MEPTELVPGDSFATEPVITNDAIYEMYVFIAVETPSVDNKSIYEFTAGDEWTLIESTAERSVWTYADDTSMTMLSIDESTTALTTQMTMKEISNTAFVELDDINVTIIGYGIGTDNVSITPSEAWTYCKQVGNIE